MSRNSDYIIHFKGLGLGQHEYNFDIQDHFFTLFEENDITKGSIKLNFILDKKSNFMEFYFNLSGHVNIPCDRCLDLYDQHIEYHGKMIVKFGEKHDEISDELLILDANEHQIDLKDYIYELILLNLPMRKVHADDENGNSTCNPEMIEKLENYKHKEESKSFDSRWSKLNDLTKSE